MDDSTILDRERLASITRGDAARAAEFLAILFEEAEGLVQRLDGLLDSSDRGAVEDIAHTLKGMASELGAMHFRAAALTLEAEAQPALWPDDIERVRAALAELRAHVLANP
jgi:HPt (histidine-containing phosphotransfer) domain-containing protein